MVYYIVYVLFLLFFWCPCMAIYVSVQYSGRLLLDIIMLTQCYFHRETRLNAMKMFCIICSLWSHLNVLTFPPATGGCSRLGAFGFFFKFIENIHLLLLDINRIIHLTVLLVLLLVLIVLIVLILLIVINVTSAGHHAHADTG